MQRKCWAWVPWVLAVLVAMGCGADQGDTGGEGSAQPARSTEGAPAAEASGQATAEVSEVSEPGTVTVEPDTGTSPSAGEATAARPPGGVAPAPGVQTDREMKNWMLLEFVDPVTQADLDWLASVGFRVDTVMGDRMVRGWLENAKGAPKLTGDERIARIQAQMR